MGFRQRERKRKKTTAVSRDQAKARKTGSSSGRWYLTVVTRKTCCAKCAGILREGHDMVYRHTPREALCALCADSHGIPYRPSLRWERSRRAHGNTPSRSA